MALVFIRLSEQVELDISGSDWCLFRGKVLLEQVLEIDKNNEKALLRLCNVLLDLDKFEECTSVLERLQEVAFQSDNS